MTSFLLAILWIAISAVMWLGEFHLTAVVLGAIGASMVALDWRIIHGNR